MTRDRGKYKPEWRAHAQRQTRARSKMTGAAPLMAGLNQRGLPTEPLPQEAQNIPYAEALEKDLLSRTQDAIEPQAQQPDPQAPEQRRARKVIIRRKRAQEQQQSLQPKPSEEQHQLPDAEAKKEGSLTTEPKREDDAAPAPQPSMHQENSAYFGSLTSQSQSSHSQRELVERPEPSANISAEPKQEDLPAPALQLSTQQGPRSPPESGPEPKTQREQEQEEQLEQDPEKEGDNEQESDSDSGSDSEPGPDSEQGPEPDQEPDQEPEPEPEPEPEAEAQAVQVHQSIPQPEPAEGQQLSPTHFEPALARPSPQPQLQIATSGSDKENQWPGPGLGSNVPPLGYPATGLVIHCDQAPHIPPRKLSNRREDPVETSEAGTEILEEIRDQYLSHNAEDSDEMSEVETEIDEELYDRKRRRDDQDLRSEELLPKRQRTSEEPSTLQKLETQEVQENSTGTEAPPPTPSQGRPTVGGYEFRVIAGDWGFDQVPSDSINENAAFIDTLGDVAKRRAELESDRMDARRPRVNRRLFLCQSNKPSAEDESGLTELHKPAASLEPSDVPPLDTTVFPHSAGMLLCHRKNGSTAVPPGCVLSLPSGEDEYDPVQNRVEDYDPLVESLSGGDPEEQQLKYQPDHDYDAEYDPKRSSDETKKTVPRDLATI